MLEASFISYIGPERHYSQRKGFLPLKLIHIFSIGMRSVPRSGSRDYTNMSVFSGDTTFLPESESQDYSCFVSWSLSYKEETQPKLVAVLNSRL